MNVIERSEKSPVAHYLHIRRVPFCDAPAIPAKVKWEVRQVKTLENHQWFLVCQRHNRATSWNQSSVLTRRTVEIALAAHDHANRKAEL